MSSSTTFKIAAAAFAVAGAFASTAHAAGFMLTEQTAGSLGRAYAGVGVDGTDISGTYYNPATMTLHPGTMIQAGFVGIGLNLDYAGDDGTSENGRYKSQAIPHGYITHQINDSTWIGLSLTVPFGMGTEYDDNWEHANRGISAEVLTFDFNPNVAWKVSDKFAVGAGVSLQYAAADLKMKEKISGLQAAGVLKQLGAAGAIDTTKFPDDAMDMIGSLDEAASVDGEVDADSWAWGWNVGFMWSPLENLRFGVSYRSKITHDADGDFTIDNFNLNENLLGFTELLGNSFSGLLGSADASATISTPAWAMATAAWDVNDLLSLYATFRWTDWSSFEELTIKSSKLSLSGGSKTITNKWRDTYLGSIGADLRLTDWWTLRGGVAYESSPISDPSYRTSIIPDADRWWFAVGSSFKLLDNLTWDISFAHLHGVHERNLYGEEGNRNSKVGKFRKLDAYLLGTQLVYKF